MSSFRRLLGRQLTSDLQGLRRRRASAAERCHTIDELRRLAERRLPSQIFDFVDGGANDEVTAAWNLADFRSYAIRPRVFANVAGVDTSTVVQGEPIALPVLAAPMGLNGLFHPAGEAAVSRAVADAGSIHILSMGASYTIEEVAAAAGGPKWFQVFIWKDRGLVRELIARARGAGYTALVVTADAPYPGARERDLRNGLSIPPRVTARSLFEGMRKPRWSAGFLRHDRMVQANMRGDRDLQLVDYVMQAFDPSVTWEGMSWVRDLWDGPLILKGVMRPDDARQAVAAGASGIVVSNHGGRQLDQAASAISALPAIVKAVGTEAEVYVDGGIRRGTDILKAIALGARACLVGRPLAFGLAAGGQSGVRRAMQILHLELELAMALTGCPSIAAIQEDCVEPRARSLAEQDAL